MTLVEGSLDSSSLWFDFSYSRIFNSTQNKILENFVGLGLVQLVSIYT